MTGKLEKASISAATILFLLALGWLFLSYTSATDARVATYLGQTMPQDR